MSTTTNKKTKPQKNIKNNMKTMFFKQPAILLICCHMNMEWTAKLLILLCLNTSNIVLNKSNIDLIKVHVWT